MFFLSKLFEIRNPDNPEEEKPFLEHLEDLRGTILKIVITLIAGLLVCFFFRNDLMEIMRAPIDGVWKLQLDTSLDDLPEKVKAETWEKATKASREGQSLTEAQREHFYEVISEGDEKMLFHIDSVNLWRSAMALSERDERDAYIQGLPEVDEKMREQLLAMSKYYESSNGAGPNPDAEFRKRTVFMQSLRPTEGFILSFKLALFAGIALTFPFLLFFILQFVLPGLHDKEKKALFPALLIGFGLFISGVLFSYFLVLPRVLEFFTTYSAQMGIANDWRIGEYISFTTQFVLIFGLAFELPVVVMTLVFLGVLDHAVMARSRAYAVLGILVTAAIITPTPDALTLGLLALPMYLLYEICIWLAWFIGRKKAKQEEEEERLEKEEREQWRAKRKERAEKENAAGVTAAAGLISHEDAEDHEGESGGTYYDEDFPQDHDDDWAPDDDSYECDGAGDYDEDQYHWYSDFEDEWECEGEGIEEEEDKLSAQDLEGNGQAHDPEGEGKEAGGEHPEGEDKEAGGEHPEKE